MKIDYSMYFIVGVLVSLLCFFVFMLALSVGQSIPQPKHPELIQYKYEAPGKTNRELCIQAGGVPIEGYFVNMKDCKKI